jgi:flagellar biosynthesis protein FlhG
MMTDSVRTIAVSGGKGGVGKTNVSVNLALSLLRTGKSVMLMDADLGMANVDVMLNLKPERDLYHVVTGKCALNDIIIEGPGGLQIVPASSGVGKMAELSPIEQGNLVRAFDELQQQVDVLIIDTAAGISNSVINFSKACQEVIVVVCDEPASLTDAYALMKVLNQEHGIKRFQVLANMVTDIEQGRLLYSKLVNVADIYLNVSIGFLGSIPMDDKLREAIRQQAPVTEQFPNSASSLAFQRLAKTINELPVLPPTTGNLEFFVGRVAGNENATAR